jgi:hypothetical protein
MNKVSSFLSAFKIRQIIIGDLHKRRFGERIDPSLSVFAFFENLVDFDEFGGPLAIFLRRSSFSLLGRVVFQIEKS